MIEILRSSLKMIWKQYFFKGTNVRQYSFLWNIQRFHFFFKGFDIFQASLKWNNTLKTNNIFRIFYFYLCLTFWQLFVQTIFERPQWMSVIAFHTYHPVLIWKQICPCSIHKIKNILLYYFYCIMGRVVHFLFFMNLVYLFANLIS